MTNEKDLDLLKSESYREKVARLHAQAICEYYGQDHKDPNDSEEIEVEQWKREAVDWLYEQGLLEGEEWKRNINEPLPLWAQAIVWRRLFEKLNK